MSMRVGLRDPEGGVQNAFVTSFFMAWLQLGSGLARGHAAGTCDDHLRTFDSFLWRSNKYIPNCLVALCIA